MAEGGLGGNDTPGASPSSFFALSSEQLDTGGGQPNESDPCSDLLMPLTVQDGYANLHLQFNIPGDPEPMSTALGIQFDGSPSGGEKGVISINALDAAHAALAGCVSSDYTLGPGFVDIGVTAGPNFTVEGDTVIDGASGADALPQNCSYLAKKVTLTGGRHGRGRMYIPGVPRSGVTDLGTLDSTLQGDFDDALTAMITNVLAVDGVQGLILFHENSDDPSDIYNILGEHVIATQRRRLR
jgi:hypothetical protein